MADMAQPPQQGVLKAQEAQNEQTFTANMMDLRLQLLSMRADYLNQLNTQATLVGGAAIGLLSSGELTVVNELSAQRIGNDEHCNTYTRLTDTGESCVFSDFEGEWADRINNYLYMASACGCLASSIWVLYTSTNLVQFGTLAALMPGENNQGTEETMRHTDLLIHHRMADVRKMFVFSLVCLIMSVMMMVWEHFEVVTCNFWIAFLIFLGFGVHAWSSDGSAVAYYERFSGLQVRDRWERRSNNCWKAGRRICYSLGALAIPFKWSHRFESLEEPEDATDDRWWMEEMVTKEVKMVQEAWKNHPMRSTGILYKTPSKYGPNAKYFPGVPPLGADAPKQEAAAAGNGAAAAGDAKKKGEPTSDPTWPDVKRWFHVDRDAKVLRLYQDKSTWKKGGPTSKSASAMNVLKKEGEIHLTKYTVIKLYTGGRKGPVSALEQGARSDLRLALFPGTGSPPDRRAPAEGARGTCAARPWTRHCGCSSCSRAPARGRARSGSASSGGSSRAHGGRTGTTTRRRPPRRRGGGATPRKDAKKKEDSRPRRSSSARSRSSGCTSARRRRRSAAAATRRK